MTVQLIMRVKVEEGLPILEVNGICNETTIQAFKSEIDGLFAKHDDVIIDLNGLKAITTKGVGLLLRTAQYLANKGGSLILVCDQKKKKGVIDLELYRFTYNVFDTQERALGFYKVK